MTVNMKVEVNGEAPETVEPGEEFNIENSYTNVTILDTSTMQIAMDEVTGQVTTFELSSDNLEKRINVAEEPLDIPATEFPDGSNEVTFQVPEEGLTVEPGEEFNIENSYTNVTILDTSTMQIAMDEVTGQVTTFELSSDNLEKRINVAEEPLDIPATEFPDGSNEVTFQVPEEGLTV